MLVFLLFMSGCSSLQFIRYDVVRIDSAHIDRDKNLYICIKGKIEETNQNYSKHTIVIPLSNNKLSSLNTSMLETHIDDSQPHFIRSDKVYGVKLNSKYFSDGCLSVKITSKMKNIKIVSNLATPKISPSQFNSKQDYLNEYNKKLKAYLNKMKPDGENGVIYQLHSNYQNYLYALIYVEKTPRFNGINKIGFNFNWSEEGFSFLNTIMAPVTVPVSTFLYLESEILPK